MAAEKFIRVSVVLPEGVSLATHSKSPSTTLLGQHIRGHLAGYLSTVEAELSTKATGPLTLTLECPVATRGDLILALESLIREVQS